MSKEKQRTIYFNDGDKLTGTELLANKNFITLKINQALNTEETGLIAIPYTAIKKIGWIVTKEELKKIENQGGQDNEDK